MNVLMEKMVLIEKYIEKLTTNLDDYNELKNIIDTMKTEIQNEAEKISMLQNKIDTYKNEKDFFICAINSLPNPIFIKNEKAEFIFFNNSYKKFFDIDDTTYIGKNVHASEYLPKSQRDKFHNEDINSIKKCSLLSCKRKFHYWDGTEKTTLYWSSGFESTNSIKGLIGEIVDISKEKKLQDNLTRVVEEIEIVNSKLRQDKKYDYLTNLYNRYELDHFLSHIQELRKKQPLQVCILLADLDHFKSVNDTYGHLFGDKVLVDFANILKQFCRESDAVIRYGGEEFLIILPNTDLNTAKDVAERIRNVCEISLVLPNNKKVTVSIGGSEFFAKETFQECLMRTDDALYEAKESGRNQVIIK